jgi:hypothetical protein
MIKPGTKRPRKRPHDGRQKMQVIAAVARGAETSRDVATDLGIPVNIASAALGRLAKLGAIRVSGKFWSGGEARPRSRWAVRYAMTK